MFTLLYGFFLSYIGYLLFPGVGPRFTLHDFYQLNEELPGVFLTNGIRDIINAGESIPKGAANALALAQRDVFPSGHTQMTLIVMYFAATYKLTSRYVLYTFGTLLIVATVYLRYHYVIDVLAGAAFMWLTIWTAPKLLSWSKRTLEKHPPH
jgi:membrane-associated phospholipid phosphatase